MGLGKLREIGPQVGNECAKGRVLCLLHRVDGGLCSEHGIDLVFCSRNLGGVRGNLAVRGDAAFVIRAAAAAEGQLRARLGDRA